MMLNEGGGRSDPEAGVIYHWRMIVTLQTHRLPLWSRAFVDVDYKHQDRASAYAFVSELPVGCYRTLGKRDKGTVRRFLSRTGISEIDRLIRQ